MGDSAKVTSVEAVDAFRAALVVYLSKADNILDDVNTMVARGRIWLETDQVREWKQRIRRCEKELSLAEAELTTARLSGLDEAVQARRMAVRKVRAKLDETRLGLERVRGWFRRYDSEVESKTKVVAQLRQLIAYDMKLGLAYLDGIAGTLADYAETGPQAKPPSGDTSGTGGGER